MKRIILYCLVTCCSLQAISQPKTELYDFIRSFIPDSTGYENVGDWAVGKPKKFPVKWKADRIEMSEDTSINFFRSGTADITINGKSFTQGSQPVKWNLILKGPRMGYSSFSIVSSGSTELHPRQTLDSLFGKKPFKAKLLKTCDTKDLTGYYYYELKLPKKDRFFIKASWININGATALRIDGFDAWSSYAAKLECK